VPFRDEERDGGDRKKEELEKGMFRVCRHVGMPATWSVVSFDLFEIDEEGCI
jgi:hypothetical protein